MRHYRKGTGPRLVLVTMLLAAGTPGMSVAQPGAGAPAAAQSTVSNARIRTWTDPNIATLMLVESLGYAGARAVVVRRPGEMPNNIILVTRATTPADLANAASALIISRRNRGERVDREIRALIGAPPVSTVPAPATRGGAAAVKRGVAGTS